MVDALDSQERGVDRQGETMSAIEKLWDHRDSVREGTVKQRNVKAWKATHFRSETESLQQVDKNRSRSHEYSDWKGLAGGSSKW